MRTDSIDLMSLNDRDRHLWHQLFSYLTHEQLIRLKAWQASNSQSPDEAGVSGILEVVDANREREQLEISDEEVNRIVGLSWIVEVHEQVMPTPKPPQFNFFVLSK